MHRLAIYDRCEREVVVPGKTVSTAVIALAALIGLLAAELCFRSGDRDAELALGPGRRQHPEIGDRRKARSRCGGARTWHHDRLCRHGFRRSRRCPRGVAAEFRRSRQALWRRRQQERHDQPSCCAGMAGPVRDPGRRRSRHQGCVGSERPGEDGMLDTDGDGRGEIWIGAPPGRRRG